ncbi:S-adenosyl-L-methionine-dependent methyltransferase [Blastocladiella britannica]|nr:S-adenosyl-L-methionine-dependent methyltransferase [Blastocladiella britannica]
MTAPSTFKYTRPEAHQASTTTSYSPLSLAYTALSTTDHAASLLLGRPLLGLTGNATTSSARAPIEEKVSAAPSSVLESIQEWAIDAGWYTDAALRTGVRALLRKRLTDLRAEYAADDVERCNERKQAFAEALRGLKQMAILTKEANDQHYEVATGFFEHCLGPHLKYSCCLYPTGNETLAEAERAMLELYCERAELVDGMSIVELGCGWGSLSLFLAAKYPRSTITAISNSHSQKAHIDAKARERGIKNLTIVTADINVWAPESRLVGNVDRVVSIEMFEHLKNYDRIFSLIHSLLRSGTGKCFVHIFVHKSLPYHFQTNDDQSWMARYFFSGGTMPSFDLFPSYFQRQLSVDRTWAVNGTHYAKTSRHWLENMDARKAECMPYLEQCYGKDDAVKWWNRWRVFYIAVEELFAYGGGDEWFVGHYLMSKKQ